MDDSKTQRALAFIATCDAKADLDRMIGNAVRLGDGAVERAARLKRASLETTATPGTIEHDFWSMVSIVEQRRKAAGWVVSRMNRLRPVAAKRGEREALRSCISRETDGFREVIDYGLPQLTAEAIVIRHAEEFDEALVATARARLEEAGIAIDRLGEII